MERLSLLIIAVSVATAVYADVIYDDQNYYDHPWWNAYSIYGGDGYETADDFETAADWTLETVRFWAVAGGARDITVDIFDDSDAGPGTVLFQEEVSSAEMTWILIDGLNYIYEVDIPVSGFELVAGTRYWLGLQSTSGDSYCAWLVMDNGPDWWENCYFYDGNWYDSYDYYGGEASACMFELHGTPADAAVEPASLGVIKAGFAE